MFKRSHLLALIGIPLISIAAAWVFCMQENLHQVAIENVWLNENLLALQEKLNRHEKEPENETLPMAKSGFVEIHESTSPERNETLSGDSLAEAVHIVQRGENLYTIGLKYGISWTTLVKHNRLDKPNTIHAGQELKIPLSPKRIATPTWTQGAPRIRLH